MVNVAYVHGQKYLYVDGWSIRCGRGENKDVVHLGNLKVAASWIRIFFLDEDLNTWLGSVALGSQLFQFCTTWLGSGLWALLVDIEGQ